MILVVGSTGLLGSMIIAKLVQDGQEVRALVRSSAARDAVTSAGATAVMGDLKDLASLRVACAGAEAVVTTANSSARGGDDTVESVDRRGNQNLVDAAASSAVRHVVLVSALGASPHHPLPFLQAKGEAEEHLRASGMAWTVLQPNLFMDGLPMLVVGLPALSGEPVVLVGEGLRRHSMVAARDVAAYAVASLTHPGAAAQTLRIGGPEAVTWHDVVHAFQQSLGRALDIRSVPLGQPVPGVPDMAMGLLASLEGYDSPVDSSVIAETYGVTPTTLTQFVHEHVVGTRRALS